MSEQSEVAVATPESTPSAVAVDEAPTEFQEGGTDEVVLDDLGGMSLSDAIDATLIVEGAYATTNNADWLGIATNIAGSWGGATNVVELAGSPANVTVFDTDAAATNRFLRLRVTRP